VALVLVTGPSVEPVTLAEAKAYLNLGAGNQELPPLAPTAALASPAAPGNVNNGDHRYLVVFVTAVGKTQGGTPTAAVTVADKTVNGQVALAGIPTGGSAVLSREIYRTAAGGSTYLLLATLADNTTTTYIDNVADASLGAGAPQVNTTDDPLLGILIASARAAAETITRRALLPQTWDLVLDRFPAWEQVVPKATLRSITSIAYVDTNGTLQTLDPSAYLVDTSSEPGRITPAFGLVWPIARWQTGAVRIRFVAGYADAASVPACVKNWMLLRIRTLWDNRSQIVIDTRTTMVELAPSFVDGLLDPVRIDDFSWAVDC
jgi:uncharacterized phiE125 gp8 family phage protein